MRHWCRGARGKPDRLVGEGCDDRGHARASEGPGGSYRSVAPVCPRAQTGFEGVEDFRERQGVQVTRQQVALERGNCSVRLESTAAELQNGEIDVGVPVPRRLDQASSA